jgi:fermentation-respiration switch protein FrsA (DUF1100 family)
MGAMGRRTVAMCVAVAVAAGAPTACTTDPSPRPGAGVPSAGPAPAASAPPAPAASAPPASGPGSPAARPAGRAPARAFAVGVRQVELNRGPDRPLPTTVWYPATGPAGRGVTPRATAAPGPFPLILFSHGLTAEPSDYRAILTRWVAAGFVVAAPAYPHTSRGVRDFDPVDLINQPADASRIITDLLKRNTRDGDPLRGRIDPDRTAAAGHSGGGITTVGLFTGSRDDRLDAGIVLAGRQLFAVPFTGPPAPMLFVHGRRDRTVEYAAGLATFRSVPWPRAMLTVTAGGHVTTDRDFEVTARTTTEFLRWSLYGDPAARTRIAVEARRGGIAKLTDDL